MLNKLRLRLIRMPLILIILLFSGIKSSLAFNLKTGFAIAITGKVNDENGELLSGVTVTEKGTSNGVTTDDNGVFSITVAGPQAILVITSIGYLKQEVSLNGRTQLAISLKSESQGLDEVIVVGYGTQKKSDLTGAVSRVKLSDIPVPNMSLGQALAGASAGVNAVQTGMAGGNTSISVRARTSLSASDEPLIVLDGIIFNGSITDINVNDIEHIDILKDASAAAVYGSRSANGVILITTKKGTSQKPRINLSYNHGFQEMGNNPMRVMNAEEYAQRLTDYYYQQELYRWYATKPTSETGRPVRPDVNDRNVVAANLRTQEERDNYLAGHNIDWVDVALRDKAAINNLDLSFAGKSNNINYYVSGSRAYEEGILKNDQFTRYTINSKVDGKLNSWLSLGLNLNYSYRDYSGVNSSLSSARATSPLANYDLDSPDNYATFLTNEVYMPHPLGQTKALNQDIRNNLFVVANARIDVPWIKGLSYDVNYSNTYYNRKNNTFWPKTIENGNSNNGRAERVPEERRSWIVNNILSYVNTFGDHHINATFLYSRERMSGESFGIRVENFDNDILDFNNLNMGTIIQSIDPNSINSGISRAYEEKGTATMGRINYVFKDRYYFTGTVRRDGFSGFGSNNQFVTLPSLSVGWTFSEEAFLSESRFYGKLRLSYGHNGNQGIGRYSSFSRMGTNNYVYGSTTAIAVFPNRLGNAGLAWEKTISTNLGFDFGLLDRRITGSIDVYTGKTDNVLVNRQIPAASGYSSVWANIGQLQNRGIDFELQSKNFVNGSFRWNTNFVFSMARDKITKLYGGDNDRDLGNSWFVGEPISSIYDLKIDGGVWTEQELFNGSTYGNWYPGQYKYQDLNHDGIIDLNNDRSIIGYSAPNYRFSIGNTLSYKNLSLYFLVNSIQGGNSWYMADNYTVVNVSQRSDDVLRMNQSAVRQYWTPQNGVTNSTGVYNAPPQHSGVYESRSFVRLQDISLSYTLPQPLLQRLGGINNITFFASGKNLHVWTKWSGWDPEIVGANANMPAMRNYSFGARLTF